MDKENKPESGIEVDLQKRRKIVKGIAGLPALVTLASGANAAGTSNPMDCVDKFRPSAGDVANPDDVINGRNCLPGSAVTPDPINSSIYFDPNDLGVGNPEVAAARLPSTNGFCLVNEAGTPVLRDTTPSEMVSVSCYVSFV